MSAPAAGFAGTDYTTFLDPNGLRGARIGVERSYFGADPQVDALMENALQVMATAGAVIVDETLLTTRAQLGLPSGRVLRYEFKADIAAYLEASGRPNGMATLEDLIAFNAANAAREMPWFGQEIFEECARLGGLDSLEYLQARETARRLSRDDGIDALMEAHQLDAIVAPATRQAWKTDLLNGTIGSAGSSGPAAIAGYPSITVPNGDVSGLPVGMLFFGRAWSEGTLIRLAYAYEQVAPHRRAARMAPTLDPPVA
jgi:amidase